MYGTMSQPSSGDIESDGGDNTTFVSEVESQDKDECCASTRGVSDPSEPCIWILGVMGVVGVIAGFLQGSTVCIVVGACLVVLGLLTSWRVRVLGQAFAIMKSVLRLERANAELELEVSALHTIRSRMETQIHAQRLQISEFREQLDDFKGMLGLLGDNVGDIDQVTDKLTGIYNDYKIENIRQTRNNLMQLFFLLDRDDDGFLTQAELKKMRHVVEEMRGRGMNDIDTDKDGKVTISEFLSAIE